MRVAWINPCLLVRDRQGNKEQPLCVIPVVTSIKEEERLIQSSAKVNTENRHELQHSAAVTATFNVSVVDNLKIK